MTLNKKICKKCYKSMNWKWGKNESENWEHGWMFCAREKIEELYFHTNQNIKEEVKEIINNCPYKLEHLVMK